MVKSKTFSNILLVIVLIALVFAILGITSPVSAATIKVDSFADNEINDSFCTLREAIIAANTDTAYRGCPAGSGEDNIAVPNGTYTLASQLPGITSRINILGASAASTIIQASACNPITRPEGCVPAEYRIFSVNSGANLRINTTTLRHGNVVDGSGGAILNSGTLFVNSSILEGNFAWFGGAIANDSGSVIINESLLSSNMTDAAISYGYGGAISNNNGTLLVERSLIEKNFSAYAGGGIYNFKGTADIVDSTVFDNQAQMGGGIWNNSAGTLNILGTTLEMNKSFIEGGGIFNEGTMFAENTTFSGNDAGDKGGGISSWDGIVNLESATFSENLASVSVGGLYISSAVLNFSNTIIANSGEEDCLVEWGLGGSIGTNMHNLVEDNSCSVGGINFQSGDPLLGPLADNGGFTKTHALLENSPAIDNAFCNSSPATDQRGEERPAGSGCDIGAYERSATQAIFLPLIFR